MCSTPDGVIGWVHARMGAWFFQDGGCSTPDGVIGWVHAVPPSDFQASRMCSTPDGVIGWVHGDRARLALRGLRVLNA